jgi:crotonobetainyl-CoA:carnitine CoA-transferase CaiB-like acyl-CoA transferase
MDMGTDESFLSPYRVLDLTDEQGYMCGKTLGGLGAEVIKVEPPGGDKGRSIGPFVDDKPGPGRSLFWMALNVGKKSITLDLEKNEGKKIFGRLVESADFVVESFKPGYMHQLGLGYEDLRKINPGIVVTSLTPYGQTGPHKDYHASDIVCWAGSGYMWLCGLPNRAPLRISVPQAYVHGGAEGAMGTMVAFWHRQKTGQGQYVDVSITESAMWQCLGAHASWDMNQMILERQGAFRYYGAYKIRFVYPCKDGYVLFMLLGGHIGARGQKALAEWMDQEGMSDEFLRNFEWDTFDVSTYTDEMARKLEPFFERFFLTKTKAELFEGALKMQYLLTPVNTVQDLIESLHFAARDFWVDIDYPELNVCFRYPGAPFKSSEVSWRMDRRAPLVGEHNREIYGKGLNFSNSEIRALERAGVI